MDKRTEENIVNTSIMGENSKGFTAVMNATEVLGGRTEERAFDWLLGVDLIGNDAKYRIQEFLTQGGEAVLFLCSDGEKKYVAKIYDRVLVINDKKRQRFINLLYKQKSPYIVPLEDYGVYKNLTFDIYPYMKNGNLLEISSEITPEFIKNVIVPDLNEALAIVHSQEVSHRDIKPQNILLSNDKKHIMLTDFSIMSIVESATGGGITQTAHRTNGYAAPEIISLTPHVKSDYYAFGIALLSLIHSGKDVYEGMDEETIRQCTMYNEIPYLNPEKFVNADGPSLTLRDSIEGLICGLTIHGVKERWGYKEVKEWCEGKRYFPPIRTKGSVGEFKFPFTWNDSQFYTPIAMAEALAKDWNNSRKKGSIFAGWLETERPDLASKVYDVIESSQWVTEEQTDASFFKLIYMISPDLPFIYWKGKKHEDFNALALELERKKYDPSFAELMKQGGISWFLQNSNRIDQISENIKSNIQSMEVTAGVNMRKAYAMFLVQFLPVNVERYFLLNNQKIYCTSQIVEWIGQYENNMGDSIRNDFFYNDSCAAWMWFHGYEELFQKASKGIEAISAEDCVRRMLILLDQIAEDTDEVRELVFRREEYAHILWLKNNLDKYAYITDLGREYRLAIDSELVDKILSVEELYAVFMKLSGVYGNFAKSTFNAPYNILYGIADEKKYDIIPRTASAAFIFQKKGQLLPAGYVAELANRDGIRKTEGLSSAEVEEENMYRHEMASSILSDIRRGTSTKQHRYFRHNKLWIFVCAVSIAVSLFSGVLLKQPVYLWCGILASAFPLVYGIFEFINMNNRNSVNEKITKIDSLQNTLNQMENTYKNLCADLKSYYSNFKQDLEIGQNKLTELYAVIWELDGNKRLLEESTLKMWRTLTFIISGITWGVLIYGYADLYLIPEVVGTPEFYQYTDDVKSLLIIGIMLGIGAGFYLAFKKNEIIYTRFMLLIVFAIAGISCLAAVVALIYILVVINGIIQAFLIIAGFLLVILLLICFASALFNG